MFDYMFRAIMMGLMLHANGKALMKKGKYRDALEVLNMGEVSLYCSISCTHSLQSNHFFFSFEGSVPNWKTWIGFRLSLYNFEYLDLGLKFL